MENLFVPYHLAKLAKEKGFKKYFRLGHETSLYTKDGDLTSYMNYGFMYSGLDEGYISAPTYDLITNWLKITHKIKVIENPQIGYNIYLELNDNYFENGWHNTIDEAIEEALKLIK